MSAPGRGPDAVLSADPLGDPVGDAVATDRRAAPVAPPGVGVHAGPQTLALAVAIGVAVVTGVLLRSWLLVHVPIWGDEAVVGVMARAIGSGHFSAFYWGQHYGGLEPYVVAVALKVAGGGAGALNGTAAFLAALSAVLVAAITAATGRDRLVALGAGAAVWIWPFVVVWQSLREQGFREATLCCGLTAILCAVRVYRGRAKTPTLALLGLALGLGWWASPEIVYFALPCVVLLVGWWHGSSATEPRPGAPNSGGRRQWRSLGIVVVGGIVGSLPWWYANVHTAFASLRASALPANGGMTYSAKLAVFFTYMLPMQLGLRTVLSGTWVGGPALGWTLYVVLLVLIVAAVGFGVWLFVRAPGRPLVPLALAVGVVCYPFVYAAAPGTGYWSDGRYGIYLPALLVVLAGAVLSCVPRRTGASAKADRVERAAAPDGHGRPPASPDRADRRARRTVRALAALGLAGAVCLTVAGAHAAGVPTSASFFTAWHNGDDPMEQVVDAMRAQHITDAYGDYWTAYDLDFLSGGSPLVSPNPLLDVTRSTAMADEVGASADPAWLFFAPNRIAAATATFQNPQPGPGPYTERTFEGLLRRQGVRFRVVKLGILDGVVPSQRLVVP